MKRFSGILLISLFCQIVYFQFGFSQYLKRCATISPSFIPELSKNYDKKIMMEEAVIIPVVVHIIYNTQEQNISDAQILSQINVLNEDFTSYAGYTWF